MPPAKVHVLEGRYNEEWLNEVSAAIQAALMNTLRVPPDDFYQLIFEFPRARFRHTQSFVGMRYSDDLIILDITFIEGRPPETRLALLKDINTRVATAAKISPDNLMITLFGDAGALMHWSTGEPAEQTSAPNGAVEPAPAPPPPPAPPWRKLDADALARARARIEAMRARRG